jgi:hypothetical protein
MQVFTLADKYIVKDLCKLAVDKYLKRLLSNFNIVEFLESIPDVYLLTAPQITLRDGVVHFSRKNLKKALLDRNNTKTYDKITAEVPTFTKDLLNSYVVAPLLADCTNCGDHKPMRALQVQCKKCNQGRIYNF